MKKLICLLTLLFLGVCGFSQSPKLYKALAMSMDTLCTFTNVWGNEMLFTDISGTENPVIISVDIVSGTIKISNKGRIQLRIIGVSDVKEVQDSLGNKYQYVYMSCLHNNNNIIVVDVFKYQNEKIVFLFTVGDYRVRYVCEEVLSGDTIFKL